MDRVLHRHLPFPVKKRGQELNEPTDVPYASEDGIRDGNEIKVIKMSLCCRKNASLSTFSWQKRPQKIPRSE
jgi:hypothetical protein